LALVDEDFAAGEHEAASQRIGDVALAMPARAALEIMQLIIVPLSKSGSALGSSFELAMVMGDFFVVKVMSGGGSAPVVSALHEDIALLHYPPAAASAVVLLAVGVVMIGRCALE